MLEVWASDACSSLTLLHSDLTQSFSSIGSLVFLISHILRCLHVSTHLKAAPSQHHILLPATSPLIAKTRNFSLAKFHTHNALSQRLFSVLNVRQEYTTLAGMFAHTHTETLINALVGSSLHFPDHTVPYTV